MSKEFKTTEKVFAVAGTRLEAKDSTATTMAPLDGNELQSILSRDRTKITEEVMAHKFSPQALQAMDLMSKRSAKEK